MNRQAGSSTASLRQNARATDRKPVLQGLSSSVSVDNISSARLSFNRYLGRNWCWFIKMTGLPHGTRELLSCR